MARFRICTVAVLFHAMVGAAAAAPADSVGMRSMPIEVPARGQMVELTVWYPAASQGSPQAVGESRIFKGTFALRDAPVAEGRYPVVMLAHGGFRVAPHHTDWIAASLAARGYIVSVTQPPALGPQDAQSAVQEIWLRPRDLSAALTAIENDSVLAPRIVPGKAAVVGFFLGGTSALALAGARLDAERYKRSCDRPGGGVDCAWFARSGVDLQKIDPANLTRSHKDGRIKAAVAVDPELSASFVPESLAGINVPVEIINLGQPDTIPAALNVVSLETAIPNARYGTVADAVAFSAFSLCTPKGPALLREEGEDEDAICRDSGRRSREDIHREITAKIEAALERGLSARP
jgi:predicted dienelactone hydrolase